MRKKQQTVLSLWVAAAAVVFAIGFAGQTFFRSWRDRIELGASKRDHLHYEIVEIRLSVRDRELAKEWHEHPPRVVIERDGQPVVTIGNMRHVTMYYDSEHDRWNGRWPVPWNAPDADYTPTLPDHPELASRVRSRPFRIVRREPKRIKKGFVAINLETANPIRTMKVRGPDGEMKDWRGLLDWTQHFKADAFWVLGGITPGVRQDQVWLKDNLPILQEMGREAHKRGLKFGIWAMCYLTAKRPPVKRYEYAVDMIDGRFMPTRSISIRDPNRPKDLAEFYKQFAAMPEVDYIGLDYIRNALGGYELFDDYFREMPGAYVPEGWEKLSPAERQLMFFRHKVKRKDKDFIDRWQWYRAHKIANIVKHIREEIGDEKVLWAFTLGWERGWQHGQDPVMMNDAGVDVDAVMLYEADKPQFDWMVSDWRRYVAKRDVQLIIADVVDWPLHQYTVDPSGPEEFFRRNRVAIEGMYKDGRVDGIFIHDLSRLLWGRKGPYSTEEWSKAIRQSIQYLREDKKRPS